MSFDFRGPSLHFCQIPDGKISKHNELGLCRRDSLSSTDRATTRRLVQSIFARVVSTQGKDLGEVRLIICECFSLCVNANASHPSLYLPLHSAHAGNEQKGTTAPRAVLLKMAWMLILL